MDNFGLVSVTALSVCRVIIGAARLMGDFRHIRDGFVGVSYWFNFGLDYGLGNEEFVSYVGNIDSICFKGWTILWWKRICNFPALKFGLFWTIVLAWPPFPPPRSSFIAMAMHFGRG